jgi:hypothetical protein
MAAHRRKSAHRHSPVSPKTQRRLWPTATASVLAVLVLAPIVSRLAGTGRDYVGHRDLAAAFKNHLTLSLPHFLLESLVVGVDILLPGDMERALIVVMLLAYAAIAAIVVRVVLGRTSSAAVALALTVALLFPAAPAFLFPLDRHLYYGYLPANVFHNPPMVLLKPLAMLSFGYATAALWPKEGKKGRTWIACCLLTVACALAKPNYTICILPALAIVAAKRAAFRSQIDWKLLVFGFALPALAIHAFQYYWTFGDRQTLGVQPGSNHIVFAPLAVMRQYSSWLAVKLLLSLLFPLSVLATNFHRVKENSALMLAWVLFVVGAGMMYLLAESGPRMIHGNMLWSAQIGIFILFVQSAAHISAYFGGALATATQWERRRALASFGCLLLHTGFGIALYFGEYAQVAKYW